MIDWKSIINTLNDGEVRTVGEEFYKNVDGRFNEIINLWKEADYTAEKVEWINYYPGKHFDSTVLDEFSKLVNCKHIRSWISCVRPGKNAPWHQDIDDDMEEYLKLGKLVRYTCFINKPEHGQVMLIEKDSYYMMPENTIIKWPDILAWHGASNCGFENHYLYHFLGYTNEV